MPELPEVTTIANDLKETLVGECISALDVSAEKTLLPSSVKVSNAIIGNKILNISRVGKMISIELESGKHLLIHLKLTGRLLLKKINDPKMQWERAAIHFKSGKSLRFDDMRLFGYIKLVNNKELLLEKGLLGEDALTINPNEFFNKISQRNVAIKKVLLDQKVLSGVGNIYANEACFKARIHPQKTASSLTKEEASNLLSAIKDVLKKGILSRGATLSDEMYRDAYGERGGYDQYVLIYDRGGNACVRKCGGVVQKIQLGGRGTYFCPVCQQL